MNVTINLSPQFAQTIATAIIGRSEIAATISNAKEMYLYVKSFSGNDKDINLYLSEKLNTELNNLKSIEFEIDNYPKKELFYKTKHQIETLLTKLMK